MLAPDNHPVNIPVGYLLTARGDRCGKHMAFTHGTLGETPCLAWPSPDSIAAILDISEQPCFRSAQMAYHSRNLSRAAVSGSEDERETYTTTNPPSSR